MKHGIPTGEAAKAVGIYRTTLHRWIREGIIKPPKPVFRNGRGVRLWSEADIARLRKVKKQMYGKRRGRKKKG